MGGIRLTQALAQAGDVAAARQAAIELDVASHPGHVIVRPLEMIAHAWVLGAEGAVSQAISTAWETARLAADAGQLAHEMAALHTAVRFGDPGPAPRLAELAGCVDGPRAPAAAAHAAALAAGDGAALDDVSVRFEAMGDVLAAADAAAQAARIHRRRGDRGRAHAATARAARLTQTCEGARTPALIAAAAPPSVTDREREIAILAAGGLTNKQIAARLHVSVRTVEGHIYRVCTRLDLSDRTALAGVFDAGPVEGAAG